MITPHRRFSRFGFYDRDNFIRNLVTVLDGYWIAQGWGSFFDAGNLYDYVSEIEIPLTPSAVGREPVLTLPEIKMHLRIDELETEEDAYLEQLEMASRLYIETILRRDITAAVGENVKMAQRFLIGHYYRNREAVGSDKLVALPLAVDALLSPERDYPAGVY